VRGNILGGAIRKRKRKKVCTWMVAKGIQGSRVFGIGVLDRSGWEREDRGKTEAGN
jgi:hypothetical protein